MAGLTIIVKVGDGEALGPSKENKPLAVINSKRDVSATEWNALAQAVQELCEGMGLADGSTSGSVVALVGSLDTRATALEATAGLGPKTAENYGLPGGGAYGVDVNNRAAILTKADGRVWMIPSRETRKAILQHGDAEDLALTLLAKGTVFGAGGDSSTSLVTYMGDVEGVTMPYVTREGSIIDRPAHVLHTSQSFDVHIGYGQSWRTNEHDPADILYEDVQAHDDFVALPPQQDAFMLLGKVGDPTALPLRVSIAGSYSAVHDIISVIDAPDLNHCGIDRGSALAFGKLRSRDYNHRVPMTHLLAGWPGTTWDQLSPTGTPVDGTSTNCWQHMLNQCAKVVEMAALYGKTVVFRAVGWTQGGADLTPGDYYNKLTAMTAAFDAAALNGPGGTDLHFFIDQHDGTTLLTEQRAGALDQAQFCKDNVNGRSWLVGPRYWIPLKDQIHHTALGQLIYGEHEALAKHTVLDLGQSWTPLWVTAVSISGAVITVMTSAPYSGGLVTDYTTIEAAQDDGWTCWDVAGSSFLTISSIVYSANTATITLSAAPTAGTVIEVGYAWRGRAGTMPDGTVAVPSHAACWGNVKMVGPPSTMFSGRTIDAWLCIHSEQVTA